MHRRLPAVRSFTPRWLGQRRRAARRLLAGGAAGALLAALLAGRALAQGFFGGSQPPAHQQASPGPAPWYGNPAAASGATAPSSAYAGWAAATASDAVYDPRATGRAGAAGYGPASYSNDPATAAALPSAARWSRSPPQISRQTGYAQPLPLSSMSPGGWDPRTPQMPGYATPGSGYGAWNAPGTTPMTSSGQYGQYAGSPASSPYYPPAQYQAPQYQARQYPAPQYPAAQSQPSAYQGAPYAPPVGNAFQPPPLPQGGFAAEPQRAAFPTTGSQPPAPQNFVPQNVAPRAAQPTTVVSPFVAPPPQGFAQPQQAAQPPGAPQPQTSALPSAGGASGGKLPNNEEILARVGPDVILMGDVRPEVDHQLKQAMKGSAPPPEPELEKIRVNWIRGRLKHAIEVRQILVALKQKIEGDEAKYQDIRKQVGEAFEKKRIKQLVEELKEKGVASREDLERRSVELFGIPFARVKQNFIDEMVAYSFVNQNTQMDKTEEVSHADAVAYYQAHGADFEFPPKARWEEIVVKYEAGKHTRDEAWRIIAQCGNAVIGGAKFDALARQYSEDPLYAPKGGAHDWIAQGSLVCEKVDQALFDPRLPVGTLSPIIEDGSAFYIIRVIERRAAGKTPFAEAQKEIKEKLKKERQTAKRKEFLDKIRDQVPVRNIFEETHPAPAPPKQPPRQRDEDE